MAREGATEGWEFRKVVTPVEFGRLKSEPNMYPAVAQQLKYRSEWDNAMERVTQQTWSSDAFDKQRSLVLARRGTATTGLVALAVALAAHETFGANMYGGVFGALGFKRRSPYIKKQALELRQRAAQRNGLRDMRIAYLRLLSRPPPALQQLREAQELQRQRIEHRRRRQRQARRAEQTEAARAAPLPAAAAMQRTRPPAPPRAGGRSRSTDSVHTIIIM